MRITAWLTAVLLCLPTAVLTACNQSGDDNQVQPKTAEPVAVDHVWKAEYITMPDGIDIWELDNPQYDGNTLSFPARRVIDKETYEVEQVTISQQAKFLIPLRQPLMKKPTVMRSTH